MAQKAHKARSVRNNEKNVKAVQKKHLIDPRYKSFVYTVIVLLILLVFFIVNNMRQEPIHGDPPNLKSHTSSLAK